MSTSEQQGLDHPGAMLLRSDLTSDAALAVVGRTIAAIEEDCSLSWPKCPRQSVLCDCRLRAVRACNALRYQLDPTDQRLALKQRAEEQAQEREG